MADELKLDWEHTAILAMDLQQEMTPGITAAQPDFLSRVAGVLDAARDSGIPVIYVVVRFREGYPEISPRNRMFSGLQQAGRFLIGGAATEIDPAVAPRPEDVVVTKHRVGAFAETDLQTVLRAKEITTLVLMGYATSGVVLSTVRIAADLDYELVVVEDGCTDGDPAVHDFLMEKILSRQALIVQADQLVKALSTR